MSGRRAAAEDLRAVAALPVLPGESCAAVGVRALSGGRSKAADVTKTERDAAKRAAGLRCEIGISGRLLCAGRAVGLPAATAS
jgi:hypothetical protein